MIICYYIKLIKHGNTVFCNSQSNKHSESKIPKIYNCKVEKSMLADRCHKKNIQI